MTEDDKQPMIDAPNPVGLDSSLSELAPYANLLREFHHSIERLSREAAVLNLPSIQNREWFELLNRKLMPQLTEFPYLVVAVVGGTNIGKSVIFNHIAGFRASSSSPLASGTKHPVCLVPLDFEEKHELKTLFPGFELTSWTDGSNALTATDADLLFWRTSDRVPANLVILDTPDVDSDAPMNWRRADAIRQASDVVVAVLTQQKYNDAAVKQFFRKAAAEEKIALVVFNQVELPEDEPYWSIWLQTFCSETGLKPEFVYLAPNDRKAAESISLKFQERTWNASDNPSPSLLGNSTINREPDVVEIPASDSIDLRAVLSQMRFAQIKLQTMRGSLKQLVSEATGAPAFLREIRSKCQQFRDAAELFAAKGLIRQTNWPAAPNSLIIQEMWQWWHEHREAWTSNIHGFYSLLGHWVSRGASTVRDQIWGPPPPVVDEYRNQEWEAIVQVIQQVYDQLHLVTTLGNELLTSRLESVLAGKSCEALIQTLRSAHDQVDFRQLAQSLVQNEMARLQNEHQDLYGLLRNADRAAAVVRPALTLLLALGGGIGADHLLINATSQSVTHFAIEATAAAGTTVAGEAVVDRASGLLGQTKAWILKLHEKFKSAREAWLIAQLNEHLLGQLRYELQNGAAVTDTSSYRDVQRLIREFDTLMAKSFHHTVNANRNV